jgi:streptogramin lyase
MPKPKPFREASAVVPLLLLLLTFTASLYAMPVKAPADTLVDIAVDPNGNIWFTEERNKIGGLPLTGKILPEIPVS